MRWPGLLRGREQPNRSADEQKDHAAPSLLAVETPGRPVWSPTDAAALARHGYEANTVAFRCARLIAESAAAIPLVLRGDEPGGPPLLAHPALRLLSQSNPTQSWQELYEALFGFLQTAGNAYLELVPGPDGSPAELHALRPDRIRVVPGADGWPAAYDYTVGRKTRRFQGAPSRILHLKSFHPTNDHYGMSPLQAAARSVDIHNAASSWAKALLDNAARPSGAVVFKGADGQGRLTDLQYTRLREELESHHQGARNAGRPMLLEGGLDWKPMSLTPADMEFQKTKDSAARDIALAFGVPPMLLGLPGDNTYANYAEANRAFTRQTLLPLVGKTAARLGTWLSAHYAEPLTLSPDLDALPALASERETRWARITAADFLDQNEKRSLLGLPPRPERGGENA